MIQQKYIKIYLKVLYNTESELVITYKDDILNEQNDNLQIYKNEQCFNFLKDQIEKSTIFESNYVEEENIVRLTIFSSKNLILPQYQHYQQILDYNEKLYQNPDAINTLQIEEDQFELFAAACILQFDKIANEILYNMKKNISLQVIIMSYLIAYHYNQKTIALSLFSLIQEFYLVWNGLIEEYSNHEIKSLLQSLNDFRLSHEQNTIILSNDQYQISFDSIVFKNSLYQQHKSNEILLKPLLQYQHMNVCRTKSSDIYEIDEQSYPHKFYFRPENDHKLIAFAYQTGPHDQILLFKNDNGKLVKYGYNYIGVVERNYWGTKFEIYDNGFDQKSLSKLPLYLASPRKIICEISYQYNIMGEVPRDFDLIFYDFLKKQDNQKLVSVKPEYNDQKDCYQLNFYGRASKASARNYQLIYENDPDSLILMHGKVNKNTFNLDFRHPINYIQAFAVSLVSISKKFLVA